MLARHPNQRTMRLAPALARVLATALLALLALPASAQNQVTLQTTEGDLVIESSNDPRIAPFFEVFRKRVRGAVIHESDKLLACDESSCACNAYDCTTCLDVLAPDPELLCANGEVANCECANMMPDTFFCDDTDGAFQQCTDLTEATCTCPDLSIPAFECQDLSPPPGACMDFMVTDQTMRAGAIRSGLYRLTSGVRVLDLEDAIPDSMLNQTAIHQNDNLTVAFVRDEMSCEVTSEWIINLQDNSDPYDQDIGGCNDGHLVFGIVVGSSAPLTAIGELATLDVANDIPCSPGSPPPAPLTDWIGGLPDATRCDPIWEYLPLFDFSVDPIPPVLGNCEPGDETCMCPSGMLPCTEIALPLCEEVGSPIMILDENGNTIEVDPCLRPACQDTQIGMSGAECTEALGANFPIIIPEPRAWQLALIALASLAVLRRAARQR
jgi:hypothetical protein